MAVSIANIDQVRHCRYLMAKLRSVERRWPNSDGDARLAKLATLDSVGYAIVLSNEILSGLDRPISSALLVRTLWHNAGQLAWLLNGPGELTDRLEAYHVDCAHRARKALVVRPRSMFGQKVAAAEVRARGQEDQIAAIEQQAAEVEMHNDSTGVFVWSRIRAEDLWRALRGSFAAASDDIGESLDVFLRHSTEAVEGGDDYAHPNPYIAIALGLVDLENQRLNRSRSSVDPVHQRGMVLTQTTGLLIAHCAAIAAYDKRFPLADILTNLAGHVVRTRAAGSDGS